MTWIVRNPVLSCVLTALLCLALAPGLRQLAIDSSSQGLLVPDDPEVLYYQESKETFGDDVAQMILIKAPDVFTPEILASIERLTLDGEVLDGVTRVLSLTTVSNLKGRDGVLDTEKLVPDVPEDPAEIERIRADALSNPTMIGEVVNTSGTTAAIHLSIESRQEAGFEPQLINSLETLIERERALLPDSVEIYQYGTPWVKTKITEFIRKDGATLGPASMVAILLVLLLFLRSSLAIVIPCVTGALSVLTTLGLMGYMGYSINPVTVIVPTLLLVIGCTEDVHLIAEYALGLRSGMEKQKAVLNMAIKSGSAIFLTSLTTFIGFATIAPNAIPMLSQFGIAASVGMALNFVLTILVVPSVFTWFATPKAFLRQEKKSFQSIDAFVREAVTRRQGWIIAVAVVLCALAIYGCFRIQINTDYINFFKDDSIVKQRFSDVAEHLAGSNNYYVIIDTGTSGGVQEPDTLKAVEKLTNHLDQRFDKALGYTSFIQKFHQEMNDGDPAFAHVPHSTETVAQYSLMLDPDSLARFVDFDYSQTCILVRCDIKGSEPINAMRQEVSYWIKQNMPPTLDIRLTGESLLISKASVTITHELLENLVLVFVAIFIVIAALFVSLKAGLLAMVPNIFPVLFNFGFMGWLGIPLSTATFPVAMVALGIAVDDTIHLMVRYSKELKANEDNQVAITQTVSKELRPVFTTSVALTIGFLILLLGEFGSIQQFGILAALAMVSALISDIFLTPVLLQATPLISAWDFLKLKLDESQLRRCPLFNHLKPNEIKKIALLGDIREYARGDYILKQGDQGDDLLVVLKGSFKVVRGEPASGKEIELARMHAGDIIGEMSFFSKKERSASAIALEPTEVLSINSARLGRVQKRDPKIASQVYFNLSDILSRRLNRTTSSLLNAESNDR